MVPPLVAQTADGENGGVMMTEVPPKSFEAVRESSGSATAMLDGTKYLEHRFAGGVGVEDFRYCDDSFSTAAGIAWTRGTASSGSRG